MEKDGWAPRSPWYLKMCREFNNDEQKIAQELDVSFLGSASNVVAPEYIEMQSKLNVREPILVDNIVEDTWIWKEPIPGHRYLCAVDNSRGDSNDRTAIEILDMDGVDEDGTPRYWNITERKQVMMSEKWFFNMPIFIIRHLSLLSVLVVQEMQQS